MLSPLKARLRGFLVPRLMPSIEEEERAYLNQALSIVDLERRQREIDAGLFRERFYSF